MGSLRDQISAVQGLQIGAQRVVTPSPMAERAASRQLEELRVGDYSSLDAELRAVIRYDQPPLHFYAIVDRVARELADLYVRPPRRTYAGVPRGVVDTIDRVYARSGHDAAMSLVAQRLIVHGSQIIAREPGRIPGTIRTIGWSPYQIEEVHYSDPTHAVDGLAAADRVVIEVPVARETTVMGAMVTYGRRVYTPTEAYTVYPDGTEVPVFRERLHGFGRIPLVGVRRGVGMDGGWLPAVPRDLLAIAIAIPIAMSDILHIATAQCHGQEYLIGNGVKQITAEMPRGVEWIIPIDVAEVGDVEHKIEQGNPAIDKYLAAVDKAIEIFATNRSITPSVLASSSGITGAAKAEERADQLKERLRIEQIMAQAEQDVLGLDVLVLAGREPSIVRGGNPTVAIDYQYVEPHGNRLQRAQADEIYMRQGRTSVEDLVAEEDGISLDAAKSRVLANLASLRERLGALGGVPTAGLDRTDKAIPV